MKAFWVAIAVTLITIFAVMTGGIWLPAVRGETVLLTVWERSTDFWRVFGVVGLFGITFLFLTDHK